MGNAVALKALRILYCMLLVVIILSKESILLRYVVPYEYWHAVITCFFLFAFSSMFLVIRNSGIFVVMPALPMKQAKSKNVVWLFLLLIAYLFIHEVIIDDGYRSYKYIAYIIFFFMLINAKRNIDLRLLSKVFASVVVLFCIASIIQFVLITLFHDISLSSFKPISAMAEEHGRPDATYVNPYLMGMLRVEAVVNYAFVEFHRICGYTTEPKYYSRIILAAMIATLYSEGGTKIGAAKTAIFIVTLLLVHSYLSFAVILMAICLYWMGLIRFNRKLLLLFLFVFPVLFVLYLPQEWPRFISGYALQRFTSLNLGFKEMLPFLQSAEHTLLGFGFVESPLRHITHTLLVIYRYGIIGFVIYIMLLFSIFATFVEHITSRKHGKIFLMSLILSFLYLLLLFFSSEIITPLYGFVIAIGMLIYQDFDTDRIRGRRHHKYQRFCS